MLVRAARYLSINCSVANSMKYSLLNKGLLVASVNGGCSFILG